MEKKRNKPGCTKKKPKCTFLSQLTNRNRLFFKGGHVKLTSCIFLDENICLQWRGRNKYQHRNMFCKIYRFVFLRVQGIGCFIYAYKNVDVACHQAHSRGHPNLPSPDKNKLTDKNTSLDYNPCIISLQLFSVHVRT